MIEIKINDDGSCSTQVVTKKTTGYTDLHRVVIAMHSIAVSMYGGKMGEVLMDTFADYIKNGTIKRKYEEIMQELENAKK